MKCDYCNNQAKYQKYTIAVCKHHRTIIDTYQWTEIK